MIVVDDITDQYGNIFELRIFDYRNWEPENVE